MKIGDLLLREQEGALSHYYNVGILVDIRHSALKEDNRDYYVVWLSHDYEPIWAGARWVRKWWTTAQKFAKVTE